MQVQRGRGNTNLAKMIPASLADFIPGTFPQSELVVVVVVGRKGQRPARHRRFGSVRTERANPTIKMSQMHLRRINGIDWKQINGYRHYRPTSVSKPCDG